MPPTISLDAGTEATGKMREILLRHPEVLTVVSQHGRPDNGSDASPFSNVELFAPLKPFDEWPADLTKEKLTEELQKEFADELPGIGFNFSQYIQDNVEEALSGVKGANSVKIVGPNLAMLEKLADQVMAEMAKVQGVADLGIFRVWASPTSTSGSTARRRRATGSTPATSIPWCRPRSAAPPPPPCWRATGSSASRSGSIPSSATASTPSAPSRSATRRRRAPTPTCP